MGWFEDIINQIADYIKSLIANVITSMFNAFQYMADQIQNSIIIPLSTISSTIMGWVMYFSQSLVDSIRKGFENITNGLKTFLHDFVADIQDAFKKVLDAFALVKQAVFDAAGQVTTHFSNIAKIITDSMASAIEQITRGFTEMGAIVKSVISNLNDVLRGIAERAFQVLSNVALLLREFFEKLINVFTQFIKLIEDFLRIEPEEIAKAVFEVQKYLLGVKPW